LGFAAASDDVCVTAKFPQVKTEFKGADADELGSFAMCQLVNYLSSDPETWLGGKVMANPIGL